MPKYVRVVRTEIETDTTLDIFVESCYEHSNCRHCPMRSARNRSRERYGWGAPSCLMRFTKRPNYWIKRFGWEVEDNE